jgi:hypothetical protein
MREKGDVWVCLKDRKKRNKGTKKYRKREMSGSAWERQGETEQRNQTIQGKG